LNNQPSPLSTFWSILHFFSLKWHRFHKSRIDVISIILAGWLIYKSPKRLPIVWVYLALGLWFFPVLTHDTMSASRFQVINLPLFIYVAAVLPKRWYPIVMATSVVGLMVVSILFVNWVWIG
jgi:hypothetical protein